MVVRQDRDWYVWPQKTIFLFGVFRPVWRNLPGRYRKVFRGRSNCWLSTLVGERKASADSKPLPGLPGTVLHTMAPLLHRCDAVTKSWSTSFSFACQRLWLPLRKVLVTVSECHNTKHRSKRNEIGSPSASGFSYSQHDETIVTCISRCNDLQSKQCASNRVFSMPAWQLQYQSGPLLI